MQRIHDGAYLNALSRLRLALKTNANSLQILPYSFDNFFISSQWSLIIDIFKFNTSLYRFLLKFLKFVGYSSIAFLVRRNN